MSRGTSSSPRARRARQLTLALLLCLALAGMPLPSVAQTTPAAAASSLDASTSGALWAYLAAIGAALVMGAAYLVRRARLSQDLLLKPPVELIEPPHVVARPPALPVPSALVSRGGGEGAAALVTDATSAPAALRPLFGPRDPHQKTCPQCQRAYSAWMVLCPFDGAALRAAPALKLGRGAATPSLARAALARVRCAHCHRRYAQGATHCTFDGKPLSQDTAEDAAQAPALTICKKCGAEVSVGRACKRGGACDAVTLRPDALSPAGVMMSMTICPRCHALGTLGQLHCAHDEELLVPLTALEANALPHTGYGARAKLCRKCGTRYGASARHCAYDGAPLTEIH